MKAIVVTDQSAGTAGMALVELPAPQAAINDVLVEVHASGWVSTELDWPSTWTDRTGRDRTPSIPGHELSGVVSALGYGTTGLSLGQRVFGLADWHRDGTLAEYVAIEARNLAPLPDDIEFTVAASLPISGLTAWQGLFQHVRRSTRTARPGARRRRRSRSHGDPARDRGRGLRDRHRARRRPGQGPRPRRAQVRRPRERRGRALVDKVDLVFDVIGGEIQKRSMALLKAGGTLVSVVGIVEGGGPSTQRGGLRRRRPTTRSSPRSRAG